MPFTDFIVGKDNLSDIRVNPAPSNHDFYWFYDSKKHCLIKRFILSEQTEVNYVCQATLIKKDDRFTPRLHFSVRYRKQPTKFAKAKLDPTPDNLLVKASVDVGLCHQHFWDLISYFYQMKELVIPDEAFSLVTKDVKQISDAIAKRDSETVKEIIKITSQGVRLSEKDIADILQLKNRLIQFKSDLKENKDEKHWQTFLEQNRWIFGYGLNYVILTPEHPQAHVGGTALDGTGQKIPDFLAATTGDIRFTVLLEIKTPATPLLSGSKPNRSGAWSLSKDLTDSLTQLQASVQEWASRGSTQPQNLDKFEKSDIYTVSPKGIIVVGALSQLKDDRAKRETFELFRRCIHGIEIMTFDELYERARFIVERR